MAPPTKSIIIFDEITCNNYSNDSKITNHICFYVNKATRKYFTWLPKACYKQLGKPMCKRNQCYSIWVNYHQECPQYQQINEKYSIKMAWNMENRNMPFQKLHYKVCKDGNEHLMRLKDG